MYGAVPCTNKERSKDGKEWKRDNGVRRPDLIGQFCVYLAFVIFVALDKGISPKYWRVTVCFTFLPEYELFMHK